MTVKVGEAYKYKGTGPTHNLGASHICVVVKILETEVILVPISSEQANFDPACTIDSSDKWVPIIKQSFCAYFNAKKTTVTGFEANKKTSHISAIAAPSKDIMERIVAGICKSKNSEPWLKKLFDCPDVRRPTGNVLRAD